GGKRVLIGTRKLMKRENVAYTPHEDQMAAYETEGKTAMFIAIEQKIMGIIAVADTVKETSKQAIQELRNLGIDVYMIT
ncbi:HAD family hydrolase, partial [Staphylococcus sp. SIMBA_130]